MTQYLTFVEKHPYGRPMSGDVLIDDFANVFHITGIEATLRYPVFVVHNPGEEPKRVLMRDMCPDYRIYRYLP